jgi:hypothetical protein
MPWKRRCSTLLKQRLSDRDCSQGSQSHPVTAARAKQQQSATPRKLQRPLGGPDVPRREELHQESSNAPTSASNRGPPPVAGGQSVLSRRAPSIHAKSSVIPSVSPHKRHSGSAPPDWSCTLGHCSLSEPNATGFGWTLLGSMVAASTSRSTMLAAAISPSWGTNGRGLSLEEKNTKHDTCVNGRERSQAGTSEPVKRESSLPRSITGSSSSSPLASRTSSTSFSPHSSSVSRTAASRSLSPSSTRPPGKQTSPDHGSPARSARRSMTHSRPAGEGRTIIATDARLPPLDWSATEDASTLRSLAAMLWASSAGLGVATDLSLAVRMRENAHHMFLQRKSFSRSSTGYGIAQHAAGTRLLPQLNCRESSIPSSSCPLLPGTSITGTVLRASRKRHTLIRVNF